MNEYFYFAHGGPGSGRYPLGSGERPYQKFEKSRSRGGGISGYIRSRREKKAANKQQKSEIESERRKNEEEKEARRKAADKERVLREGTATEVMRYQGELTNQELQNAFTRLNLESNIRALSQKEMKSAMDQVDSIMKKVKMGTEWVRIGTDAYNSIAAIYNTTSEGQNNPLTLVRRDGGGGQRQNR